MIEKSKKIQSFTDLYAWQEAHKLALSIYAFTKKFPKEELFGLVSQMRRASVSVTSNIAEGFGRISYREKIQFYSIALGSVTELQSQLFIVRDIEYTTQDEFDSLNNKTVDVYKLLNALIRASRTRIA